MFIRIFHSSIEFIPCESKLRYSGVGVGLIFDLSTIDSASCNSFMFKIIGADIENVLVRRMLQVSFEVSFIALWWPYRIIWPLLDGQRLFLAFFNMYLSLLRKLQLIGLYISVVAKNARYMSNFSSKMAKRNEVK